ncbi:MAG: hypothetical protein R3C12_21595 [Planctomycetaceae bacterium]
MTRSVTVLWQGVSIPSATLLAGIFFNRVHERFDQCLKVQATIGDQKRPLIGYVSASGIHSEKSAAMVTLHPAFRAEFRSGIWMAKKPDTPIRFLAESPLAQRVLQLATNWVEQHEADKDVRP